MIEYFNDKMQIKSTKYIIYIKINIIFLQKKQMRRANFYTNKVGLILKFKDKLLKKDRLKICSR